MSLATVGGHIDCIRKLLVLEDVHRGMSNVCILSMLAVAGLNVYRTDGLHCILLL